MFRAKSREEKMVDYLIGIGFLSNIPDNDTEYYHLAGSCSSVLWPTKPRMKTKSNSVVHTENQKCSSARTVEGCSFHSVEFSEKQENTADGVLHKMFKPKPVLPFPLFQETFRKWKSSMDLQLRFRRLRKLQGALVLQPLDEFPIFLTQFQVHLQDYGSLGFFDILLEFMKVFFTGASNRLNSSVETSTWNVTSRTLESVGMPQLLASDLNQQLAQHCLPSDAFAVVGITWTDLYPNEKQKFVLGETHAEHHSATISFGRFETKSKEEQPKLTDISSVEGDLIWKMIKVISHETCHLFYMSHCVFFDCLMNESSSVPEAMSQPFYLCPVCMRKLQKVLRFPSVVEYQKNLLHFLRQLVSAGLANQRLIDTVKWLEQCVTIVDNKSSAV